MIRQNIFKLCVLVSFLVTLVNGFPGGFKNINNDDVETVDPEVRNPNTETVIILPLNRGFGDLRPQFSIGSDADDADDDIGFGSSGFSIFRPRFDDIFSSMQNFMKKWREDLASSFSSGFGGIGVGNLNPWGQRKTNSTTQEIDGHILTVNETTYNNTNEFGSTIIRVRVVDIKPKNSTDKLLPSEGEIIDVDIGGEEVTDSPNNKSTEDSLNKEETTARSVETVEDQKNNEIPGVLQA